MKKHLTRDRLPGPWLFLGCLACMAMLLPLSAAWGAFGFGDDEKPKPEYTQRDDIVTAKLFPRGRRTSIQIDFAASGGKLESVETVEFETAERPEADKKAFRSGLFELRVGAVAPGGEARVSMASNYFTKSTQFWAFNPKATPAWVTAEAEYKQFPERVWELGATVKDGGPLDSDGEANGEIVLIFGPQDAFWSYAIGTLFIRFFGVFMVLTLLQIGMYCSSSIFQRIENRAARARAEAEAALAVPPAPEPEEAAPSMDANIAAAIAMALHLHLSGQRRARTLQLSSPEVSTWSQQGRARIMEDRSLVFDHINR